jgi:hypothetical protein
MTGTNEVALWAHYPYISPFSHLPPSVTGAQSLRVPIHSHLQYLDPVIYTFTFLGLSSTLFPRGAFFSCHVQVHMLTFSLIKFLLYVLYHQIFFTSGTWFSCVQVLAQQAYNPFRYMYETGM